MATNWADVQSNLEKTREKRSKLQDKIASIKAKIADLPTIKDKKKRKTQASKLQKQLEAAEKQLKTTNAALNKLEVKAASDGVFAKTGLTQGATHAKPDTGSGTGNTLDVTRAKQVLAKDYSARYYGEKSKDHKSYLYLSDKMSDNAKYIYHANNMFGEKELDIFNKTYRFGYFNTQSVSAGREFLFFTKPDLNIMNKKGQSLPYFNGSSYIRDIVSYRKDIIRSLQISRSKPSTDYFNHLLQNQCISSLDIPGLTSSMIETPTNDYGVGYSYRGSSEASDDNPEFSLEFKDNKWLDVFHFFKVYEYYETMKHHGTVAPDSFYIENRIIHDQFSIYKFIVAEDMETIIYWGKMYGVCPKSLPRDAFSNATFDDGIKYSVDFQAAFYEDMVPDILADFNALSRPYYSTRKYQIHVHNTVLDMADGRAAKSALVKVYKSSRSPSKFVYKLKWRGDDVA